MLFIDVLLDNLFFSVTTKLHNTEEFINQGGVWVKEEAIKKDQNVSGLAIFYCRW